MKTIKMSKHATQDATLALSIALLSPFAAGERAAKAVQATDNTNAARVLTAMVSE